MNAIVRLVPPLVLGALLWPLAASAQGIVDAPPRVSVDGGEAWSQDAEAFSEAELEQLLAPVALYPDVLLSQLLIAATYPLEVVEAARWSRENPDLRGEEAVNAVAGMDWDPSVMALVAFPDLLARMSEDLGWTRDLGDAFLYQEGDVVDAVQSLRQRAHAAGHLQSTEQVRVVHEERVIHVQPANPRVIYVPYYDPLVVYGGWRWSAYRPYHWAPPPVYHRHAAFYWSYGVPVSAGFFFSTLNWHARHVVVVHNHVHLFPSRPSLRYYDVWPRWQHNPVHRRGVVYRHHAVRTRYVGVSHGRAGRTQRSEVAGAMRTGVRSGSFVRAREDHTARGQRTRPSRDGDRREVRSGTHGTRAGADRRRDAQSDAQRHGTGQSQRRERGQAETRPDSSRRGGALQSRPRPDGQGDTRRRADAAQRSPGLSGTGGARGGTTVQRGGSDAPSGVDRTRRGGSELAGRPSDRSGVGGQRRDRTSGAPGISRSAARSPERSVDRSQNRPQQRSSDRSTGRPAERPTLRGSPADGAAVRSAPQRQATRPSSASRAPDTTRQPAPGNRAGGTRSAPRAPSLSGSRAPSISRGVSGTRQGVRAAPRSSQGVAGSGRGRGQRQAR